MGLLGRLTGWDTSQSAFNIACAELLYQQADQDVREMIRHLAIEMVSAVQTLSREDTARMLSSADRKTQLNVIAVAAARAGLESPVNGYPWAVEKNPFVSAARVDEDRILAALKIVERSAGQPLVWPGNDSRLVFSLEVSPSPLISGD